MHKAGLLSVVSTPIGNLEDITLRAIRVLTEAAYVLCEDTRVTGKLLKHYQISTVLKRYDAHANERVHAHILEDLKSGKHIALVSDAGTPGISDPGVLLVSRARAAHIPVESVPGPSALTAAVSVAGLVGNQFAFLGFAPLKKGRQTFIRSLSSWELPVIFYESPHRIRKTLDALAESLDTEKKVTLARELTKLHEEVVTGTPQELLAHFDEYPDRERGEFVVIISGR